MSVEIWYPVIVTWPKPVVTEAFNTSTLCNMAAISSGEILLILTTENHVNTIMKLGTPID